MAWVGLIVQTLRNDRHNPIEYPHLLFVSVLMPNSSFYFDVKGFLHGKLIYLQGGRNTQAGEIVAVHDAAELPFFMIKQHGDDLPWVKPIQSRVSRYTSSQIAPASLVPYIQRSNRHTVCMGNPNSTGGLM